MKTIQPVPSSSPNSQLAADLVRKKLQALYSDEPPAKEEEKEVVSSGAHSKHQKFIQELMTSGESQEVIQVKWHEYYASLNDTDKQEVWKEFYEYQNRASEEEQEPHSNNNFIEISSIPNEDYKPESVADLKKRVLNTVSANGRLKKNDHVKSFAFSVVFASLITGVLFFITNNERFIAPFIQPSKNASAAPIITDGTAVGQEAKIIIPKINLEAPLSLDSPSNAESDIQKALEKGVTLYPDTGKPGEVGNPTFFGHSSNNLFNKGAYKFVFVRLHQLEVGDTYAINYNGVQYVYKIFSREIVSPNRVDILYARPKDVMSTLITCDPPGTSNNRLVLQGEQISPDPAKNVASTATISEERPEEIPSNAPSLLSRLFGF